MKKPLFTNLVIVLPCYNCGKAVGPVVEGLSAYADRILAINDGSTDDTPAMLETLPAETMGWPENQGKGTALISGFRYWLDRSDWEYCLTIDSDGQHDPADLPAFMETAKLPDTDIVVGKRNFSHSQVPLHRRLANTMSSTLIGDVTGCPVHDIQCGYRLLKRSAIERLLPHLQEHAYALETEMLLEAVRLRLKLREVPVRCIYTDESTVRSAWRPFTDSWEISRVVYRHIRKR